MSSLYELVQQFAAIEGAIVENGGEITETIEQELLNIESGLSTKADKYSFIMERLEASAEHWRIKAKKMQALAKGCETVHERMKQNIKSAMDKMSITEICGDEVKFKLSKRGNKLVFDGGPVDTNYLIIETISSLDTKRIKEALESGKEVLGCKLEPIVALLTSANKGIK